MDFIAKIMARDTDKSYNEINLTKININNKKINILKRNIRNPLKNTGKEKHKLKSKG